MLWFTVMSIYVLGSSIIARWLSSKDATQYMQVQASQCSTDACGVKQRLTKCIYINQV
jgi:hypothetical protein